MRGMLGSVFLMLVALPVGAVFINGVEYTLAVTQMDISVLYIEAVSALSIFGIFMVAYGSNNKYSLLGAFRNFARMVGYEVPLGITVISVAAMTGSLNIVDISIAQGLHWNIFLQPLGCFVFFVSLMADMGRLPFDQNESEEELIAGWITEYCGMRFGLGFFAEYIHMGYVLLGSAGFVALSVSGAMFQQFSHGLIMSIMFMSAGAIQTSTGTRIINNLGGLAKKMPSLAVLMMLGFMASLGLPGLTGFIAEFLVLAFSYVNLPGFVLLALLAIVITAGYHLWAMQRAMFGVYNEKLGDVRDINSLQVFSMRLIMLKM